MAKLAHAKPAKLYKILQWQMAHLEKEVAKLNRRAEKIGCPPIKIKVHHNEMAPNPYEVERLVRFRGRPLTPEELAELPTVEINHVEIIGKGPKVDGYKFIGTLDHATMPGKVIVQSVPGETVPPQFFEVDATCHHCNKIRSRRETFIVEKEDDFEYMQVGRQCLKDFFGHDPSSVANFLGRVFRFLDKIENGEEWHREPVGMRMGDWYYLDKMTVLETTTAIIRTFGWTSKAQADDDRTATASYVAGLLLPVHTRIEEENQEQLRREVNFRPEKDEAEAKAAIEWLNEQEKDPSNSYMHNLGLINESEQCPVKMLGYWTSLIATYQRAMERLMKTKKTQKLNEHFGTVGERFETTVQCTSIRFFDNDWGGTTLHKMLTEEGHTLMWWASTNAKMESGNRYVIRGRVKKHEEYKNWKQTILTRVNVREDLGEVQPEKEAA